MKQVKIDNLLGENNMSGKIQSLNSLTVKLCIVLALTFIISIILAILIFPSGKDSILAAAAVSVFSFIILLPYLKSTFITPLCLLKKGMDKLAEEKDELQIDVKENEPREGKFLKQLMLYFLN